MKHISIKNILFSLTVGIIILFWSGGGSHGLQASSIPYIVSPTPNSTITSSSQKFIIDYAGLATSAQYLTVGTWAGADNIFAGYLYGATTKVVTGIPLNGNNIHVWLQWKLPHENFFRVQSYEYKTSNGVIQNITPDITSPSNGSTIGSSQQFSFKGTEDGLAEAKLILRGSPRIGRGIFYNQSVLHTSGITAHGIPTDGRTIYATLSWRYQGQSSFNRVNYSYKASNGDLVTPVYDDYKDGVSLKEVYSSFRKSMNSRENALYRRLLDEITALKNSDRNTYGYLLGLNESSLLGVRFYKDTSVFVNFDDLLFIDDCEDNNWGSGTEDFLSFISHKISDFSEENNIRINYTEYLFDGKIKCNSFYSQDAANLVYKSKSGSNRKILLSAGHGIYFSHRYGAWMPQRDKHNGVLEDTKTPQIVTRLKYYLKDRSKAGVSLSRQEIGVNDKLLHTPSGNPWWKMSSRDYLKKILPKQNSIWNSRPKSIKLDRYKRDDTRARPLYANYLGVDTFVSVHTNGGGGRGAEFLYHPKRANNKKLAASISCYMKEIISNQDSGKYNEFKFRGLKKYTNKAEIEKVSGRINAALVEVAYHDNVNDAKLLKDPNFIELVAKGIEKGTRMFHEGKNCIPLSVNLSDNGQGGYQVLYSGFPTFPMEFKTEFLTCPATMECRGGVTEIKNEESLVIPSKCILPIDYMIPIVAQVKGTLIDADGVSANTTFPITCSPQPS